LVISDAHRFSPAAHGDGVVYGACSPGWHSAANREAAVEQWIGTMQRNGIERVCCLLNGRRLDGSDAVLGTYREAFGDRNVLHVPVPIGHLVDGEALCTDILPFLREAAREDEPVVVHCLSGIGRTGQVLAAWLVADRGESPREAIETVRTTGRDPMDTVERGEITRQELLAVLGSVREGAK